MGLKLSLVFVLTVASVSYAQKASIKRVELAGEKVIVYYDLEDSNPANEYQIHLFSSQNNFTTALAHVKGDVGNEVKPGYDRKIEWRLRDELGPYKGRIALEIRGKMFIAVAKINGISAGDRFKRGKSYLFNWKPGNTNPVNIELMKGDQAVATEANVPNNGAINFFIPPHSKAGDDYILRITDTKNPADFSISPQFQVRRRVPLGLKVLPVALVGGAVMFLIGDDKPSPGIPDPPHPD